MGLFDRYGDDINCLKVQFEELQRRLNELEKKTEVSVRPFSYGTGPTVPVNSALESILNHLGLQLKYQYPTTASVTVVKNGDLIMDKFSQGETTK
jgi:hypothetical protein